MMKSHEVDYTILGDDMQMVEIELDQGETVIAEAGAMNYMEDGITFETKMGDGAKPEGGFWDKLKTVGKRVLSGSSVFISGNPTPRSQRLTALSVTWRRAATSACVSPSVLRWSAIKAPKLLASMFNPSVYDLQQV